MFKLFRKTPQDIRILRGPFRGARMYLNPADSKRKIFGLYEHVLNDWIAAVAPKKDFIFDVGSNTGYDLYGLAHLVSHQNTRHTHVVGFEPGASRFPELMEPAKWPDYSNCRIEIIEKFAGNTDSDTTITLDHAFLNRPHLAGLPGLIKMDVEGQEVQVLSGARALLDHPANDWLIEIHGPELIPTVASFFVERSRPFVLRDMDALPLIGPESRKIETFWLTTLPFP